MIIHRCALALLGLPAPLVAQTIHSVTAETYPLGAGSIAGIGSYETGDPISVLAAAEPGFLFSGWRGNRFTLDNPFLATVDEDLHLAALFVPDTRDTDSDGLTTYDEVTLHGSNPNLPDSDNDGISDGNEIKAGTDPNFNEDGTLLMYEGFEYTPENLLLTQLAEPSGTGWAAPWGNSPEGSTAMTGAAVRTASLAHQDLATRGAHLFISGASGSARFARELASPIVPTEGQSLYLSWIGQRTGEAQDPVTTAPPNPFPRGVDLRFWDSTGEIRLNLGNLSNNETNTWKIVARDSVFETGHSFTAAPSFFVLRIDFTPEGTADILHLWINPDLAAPENLDNAMTFTRAEESRGPWNLTEVTHVGFFVGDASSGRPHGEFLFDEFRMGTGFRAVTPRIENPLDRDKDALDNLVETNTGIYLSPSDTGTDPDRIDSDGDGLSDGAEVLTHLSDPNNPDTDEDGLTDGAEVLTHASSPLHKDSDGDTFSDPLEVALSALGFDPAVDSSPLITLVARNAAEYGLFRSDQIDTLVANGVRIEQDPDEGGFLLRLNLWTSQNLNDWTLLDLSGETVRGTEQGLEVSLPPPNNHDFYEVEVE